MNHRVLVVGLGGVGAYAAEAIARAGVGTMTIADADDQYAGVSQSFDAVASQQQFRALHPFFHRPNRFR